MSIHKLSAGSGYDYLTRQVAALDATEKGHVGLASYYTKRGETPGAWIGSGMAGIDEAAPPTTSTSQWSATATPMQLFSPTVSIPGQQPSCSSRS
jgi:hypothetical protein